MAKCVNTWRHVAAFPSAKRSLRQHVGNVRPFQICEAVTNFGKPTVGFHNFSLRTFNLRVSNPNKLTVNIFLTRCRISMCQGLGPKNHEISETDRSFQTCGPFQMCGPSKSVKPSSIYRAYRPRPCLKYIMYIYIYIYRCT